MPATKTPPKGKNKNAPKPAPVDDDLEDLLSDSSPDDASDQADDQADDPGSDAASDPLEGDGDAGGVDPGDAEAGEDPKREFSAGYEVFDIPVAEIKHSDTMCRTEDEIAEMAKSIRQHGLETPILIGTDYRVVAGDKRLAAYKKLGRKMIPCKFKSHAGKPDELLSSGDTESRVASVVENLHRSGLPPMVLGRIFKDWIEQGICADDSEVAKKIGGSMGKSQVARYRQLAERGTEKLAEAIKNDRITFTAAALLLGRAGDDPEAIDAALAEVLASADGKKVTGSDVLDRTSQRKSKPAGGRKQTRANMHPDALNSSESGITGKLERTVDGYTVHLLVEVRHEAKTLAKFDLQKKVQALLMKLDVKAVQTELENLRQQLES